MTRRVSNTRPSSDAWCTYMYFDSCVAPSMATSTAATAASAPNPTKLHPPTPPNPPAHSTDSTDSPNYLDPAPLTILAGHTSRDCRHVL